MAKAVITPVTIEADEKKAEPAKTEATEPVVAETKTEDSTEKPEKPAKGMTDAERAAIRAAKFGVAAVAPAVAVASDEKKLERAKRFGLPVTSSDIKTSNKIGAVPSADLDTLKKRAERFGQTTSNTMKKLELDEKIKKRAERFGAAKNGDGPAAAKRVKIEVNKALIEPKVDPAADEKLKKRAERFSVAKS